MTNSIQIIESTPRWAAYLEQLRLTNNGDRVLEVGKNKGEAANLMASRAKVVDTFDIDENTNPTYVGDCTNWEDLKQLEGGYDVIFCCQVLEHMEPERSFLAASNLLRLNPDRLVLSLPDNRKTIRFGILLGSKTIRAMITRPRSGKEVNQENSRQHRWEIYWKNIDQIIRRFQSFENYKLTSHYRLFDRPFQHFLIFQRR